MSWLFYFHIYMLKLILQKYKLFQFFNNLDHKIILLEITRLSILKILTTTY
uniref:Unkown protein n=1 Tax=Riptortus pedestris TaxID=329032 RepID=R4WTN8_RIPPE|nr:unkown protein [Riptortus pedestris]